jgi:hypothetical protein
MMRRSNDAIVEEGRLIEVPTPDASGMERRAFGEFESRRGELASYAFGWTTGADPRVARFTVGTSDASPAGKIGHLWHALDEDSTLIEVANLEPGESAVRERVGGPWKREREEPA